MHIDMNRLSFFTERIFVSNFEFFRLQPETKQGDLAWVIEAFA